MKTITRSFTLALIMSAASALHGAPAEPRGVAGVDVFLKQNPSKRVATNARGMFAIDGLPAGPYTLTFRAKKADDTKTQSTTDVTVATSYSVRIEGARRIIKTGLTSDNLIGGFELRVDGAGPNIRGQVMADALVKMVWIPKEPGSHIPGRWVPKDSPEAKRAFKSNAYGQSGEGLRRWIDKAQDVPQEGSPSYDRTRPEGR